MVVVCLCLREEVGETLDLSHDRTVEEVRAVLPFLSGGGGTVVAK